MTSSYTLPKIPQFNSRIGNYALCKVLCNIITFANVELTFLPTRRPTPEGRPSSWQIIEPYVSTEEKSHLSVRDLFLTIFGCK